MIRFRIFLPALVVAAIILGAPVPAHAGFAIRVTEFNGAGVFEAKSTVLFSDPPGSTVTATFDGVAGPGHGAKLPDFNLEVVTNTSSTGPGFSSHDTTISVSYRTTTPPALPPIGAGSDKLLIEVLGDSYNNPSPGSPTTITSSGSSSSSRAGLTAASLTMTSGVINGTVALSGTNGATLGGQLGMTTGTGSIPASLGAFLNPNPAVGASFTIADPFTFYQTYTISGVTKRGSASITGSSEVDGLSPVPAPAGLLLALSGLVILGGYGWLRRAKAILTA